MKRRRRFIIILLQGALRGLAYMHDHDRLHQSLGPFSVSLKYVTSRHLALFSMFSIWILFPSHSTINVLNFNMMAAQFLKQMLPI